TRSKRDWSSDVCSSDLPIKRNGDKLVTGFIKRRTPGEILPLSDYYVNDPVIDQTIGTVRDILNAHHVSVFSDETQQGEMRYIMRSEESRVGKEGEEGSR